MHLLSQVRLFVYHTRFKISNCSAHHTIKGCFCIGGFRDTYLGRQVVSKPGGPRAGIWSAGGLGALRAPLAGSGAEPPPKSNLLPFSLKISHQMATISIIFNAMQTTNFKVKNIWGGNASPCL